MLATAALSPLLPAESLGWLREARLVADSAGGLRTLKPKQNATVVAMAELILPETETPGATTARVNEFIDLILTEWCTDAERERFLRGLANVDEASRKSFNKNFADCDHSQQSELIKGLDDAMAAAFAGSQSQECRPDPTDNFFYTLKQLTLTGYFTSEVGAKRALHFRMIPGHYDGCVAIAPEPAR